MSRPENENFYNKPNPENERDTSYSPPAPPSGNVCGNADIQRQLEETEKQLASEKEKVLRAEIKEKQSKMLEAQLESSLKEMQKNMQRDRREQEMQEERAELREKLKRLEDRLVSERETWVHVLKNNLQQAAPAAQPVYEKPRETASVIEERQRALEHTIFDRLEAMERRWTEERKLLQRAIEERDAETRSNERFAQLEDKYRRGAQEKSVLISEISGIKSTLSKLERQGDYLDQISTVVLALRDAVSTLGKQSGAAIDFSQNVARKEEEYLESKKQIKNLARLNVQSEALAKDREAQLGQVKNDKNRAVAELLNLKKGLTRIRAVNNALERELNRVEQEKRAALKESAEQAAKIVQLKKDIAETTEKYHSDVSELTRKWEDRQIETEDLSRQVLRIRAQHEIKVAELNKLLTEQAESYQVRIDNLATLQKAGEEKLRQVEESREDLERRYEILSAEKKSLQDEKSQLVGEKQELAEDLRRLQAEKTSLSEHLGKLTDQSRLLLDQKLQLDNAVKDLSSKLRENQAIMENLTGEVTELNAKNVKLIEDMGSQKKAYEDLVSYQQNAYQSAMGNQRASFSEAMAKQEENFRSELENSSKNELQLKELLEKETAMSAALALKIERLEKATRTFAGRFKWAITGVPPRDESEIDK